MKSSHKFIWKSLFLFCARWSFYLKISFEYAEWKIVYRRFNAFFDFYRIFHACYTFFEMETRYSCCIDNSMHFWNCIVFSILDLNALDFAIEITNKSTTFEKKWVLFFFEKFPLSKILTNLNGRSAICIPYTAKISNKLNN